MTFSDALKNGFIENKYYQYRMATRENKTMLLVDYETSLGVASDDQSKVNLLFKKKFNSLNQLSSDDDMEISDEKTQVRLLMNLEKHLKAFFKNAKHHDRTSLNVLEYIMYQTGNIIRLLITLEKG